MMLARLGRVFFYGAAALSCGLFFCIRTSIAQAPLPVIGLGLDKLQWGRGPREIQAAYPALEMHWETGT
jgi:hypothetical protein